MARELFQDPPALTFNHKEEDKLRQVLETMDRSSILQPIIDVNDVTFDTDGRLREKQQYRMTSWAFFQLCQLVCPGLHGVITELAGLHRTAEEDRNDFSFDDALRFLNDMIKRRFNSRLCGKMMLRNLNTKTVDGVVTPKYHWLSNFELYQRVKSTADSQDPPQVFLEASLYGRWMLLRYISPTPCATLLGPQGEADNFFQGLHFSNNESGQASVKAACLLYRKFSKSVALSPSAVSHRLRHVGSDFNEKLDGLIGNALAQVRLGSWYEGNLEHLKLVSMGFGHNDVKQTRRALESWSNKLARRKVPPMVARKVLNGVLQQPSYEATPLTVVRRDERTVFDLYNALGRDTKELPINQRELAEQAAYALLMGKIPLDV